MLKDFLDDLLDPRRAVEIDDRVPKDTGRTNPNPGTKQTKGYTGIEGLLNYAYFQTGAINQFDRVSQLLHFTLYDVESGPCSSFSSGRNTETGAPEIAAQDGGVTNKFSEANLCTAWLGKNQPGITEPLSLPKYDPSVCPNGTEPAAARETLCDPNSSTRAPARTHGQQRHGGNGGQGPAAGNGGNGGGGQAGGGAGGDNGGAGAGLPGGDVLDNILDDLPPDALDNLPGGLGDALQHGQHGGGVPDVGGAAGGATGGATGDLLDFLFAS
jgi:hypothetical protein